MAGADKPLTTAPDNEEIAEARAAPDGYTLTVGSAGAHGVNQSLYPKLPYNVLCDFQPVARLSDAPSILAVHPSLPVHSVKDLIALAHSRPAQIMYASAGAGTSTHLAAALFEHLARGEMGESGSGDWHDRQLTTLYQWRGP